MDFSLSGCVNGFLLYDLKGELFVRVIVFGPSGAGKSALLSELSRDTGVRYFDIYRDFLKDCPRDKDGYIPNKFFNEAEQRLFWMVQDEPRCLVELGVEPGIIKRFYKLDNIKTVLVTAELGIRQHRMREREPIDQLPAEFVIRQQQLTDKIREYFDIDLVVDTTGEHFSNSFETLSNHFEQWRTE